jgi:anthranilate synthase/aminodeoxychorismate synthase-like glutamine amidotransferase
VILLIDNYDSFVWNLARYVGELGHRRLVMRNDKLDLAAITTLAPSHIIISPGPCGPLEAGISNAVIERFGAAVPILGVCLGHQCIGHVYGGKVDRARRPMHGKTSAVSHDGRGVFRGLPHPLRVTRYHSLIVRDEGLPDSLEVTARSEEGEIMGLRHRDHPVVGVQFHPEAVLTEHGHDLLRNFLGVKPHLSVGSSAGRLRHRPSQGSGGCKSA